MVKYTCAKCKAAMESPDSTAGIFETCPECGAIVVVPSSAHVGDRICINEACHKSKSGTCGSPDCASAYDVIECLGYNQFRLRRSSGWQFWEIHATIPRIVHVKGMGANDAIFMYALFVFIIVTLSIVLVSWLAGMVGFIFESRLG